MNYKLAKQLKDAGFPQPITGMYINKETDLPDIKLEANKLEVGQWAYKPPLEEVIEELGEGNLKIERYVHVSKGLIWSVLFKEHIEADGKDQLEAVSNLYIKLNK